MIFILSAIAAVYLLMFFHLRKGFSIVAMDYESGKELILSPVSVVIAARDEADRIERLLDSLARQTYPAEKIEFIIVDDHSTDGTADVIAKKVTGDSRFQLLKSMSIPPDMSPKKWALVQGIEASSGTILFMTDADCVMGESWVVEMVKPFSHEKVGMVLGSSPLGESNSPWDRAMRMDSIGLDALMASSAAVGHPFTASGRNIAVRRTVFDEVGGYNAFKSFASGDDDLLMHVIANSDWGVVPCLAKGSDAVSPSPGGVAQFIRQRLRFASKGRAYYRFNFIRPTFRFGLALIFGTNVAALWGQLIFLSEQMIIWLLPWFMKMAGDGLLITAYLTRTERSFDLTYFLMNEVWHPLYVTFFGTLGPLLPISWKGRQSTAHRS